MLRACMATCETGVLHGHRTYSSTGTRVRTRFHVPVFNCNIILLINRYRYLARGTAIRASIDTRVHCVHARTHWSHTRVPVHVCVRGVLGSTPWIPVWPDRGIAIFDVLQIFGFQVPVSVVPVPCDVTHSCNLSSTQIKKKCPVFHEKRAAVFPGQFFSTFVFLGRFSVIAIPIPISCRCRGRHVHDFCWPEREAAAFRRDTFAWQGTTREAYRVLLEL